MAYKPPTTPTSDPAQKEPVIQGSSDQKPYVGKPKPMPPTPKPPQRPVYGSSDGSGFDFQKYLAGQHRPRPVQVLPGQGQGPMPVGTKPLPSPVVKDPRTGGFDPRKFNDPFYRGTRFPSPEEIAQHESDRAAGGLGGGYTADMGDNRLYRDPSTEPGNPEFRNFLGDMKPGGMTRGGDIGFGEDPNKRYGGGGAAPWLDGKILPMDIGPGSANQRAQDSLRAEWEAKNGGGGQPPWLQGRFLPMDIGPGSANERARAALRADWEAKNGPWQGGPMMSTGDNRLNRGDIGMRPPGFDGRGVDAGFSGEMTTGLWNPPDRNPGENPNDYYARTRAGGGMPISEVPKNIRDLWANGGADPYGGMQDMKGGLNQGGQSVAPGMGMPTQYGGPTQARDFNVPNYGAPVQRGPGAPGSPPPVGTGPGSMGKPRQPRPNRPPQGRPPVNPQQMQQGAQALYNDNTIPHEFKGQLMQAAQSGDPQAFNDMLFNSNIPHETKLRLQQMFGYGGQGGAPMQSATPDQGQNPYQEVTNGISQAYNGVKGSPYYGAF